MDGTTARLADYQKWEGFDPFEEHTGPFYYREASPGRFSCAFPAERRHVNASGAIHGGCLMSFADYSLFVFAKPALTTGSAVTISFASEFVDAGFEGDFVEAEGEMVRETGSLIFSRGTVFTRRGEQMITLLTFSGVLKKIRNPG